MNNGQNKRNIARQKLIDSKRSPDEEIFKIQTISLFLGLFEKYLHDSSFYWERIYLQR